MNNYVAMLECEGNVSKKEMFAFLEQYRDASILIHYDNEASDDDTIELFYTGENLAIVNDIINHSFVNGIYIVEIKELDNTIQEEFFQSLQLANSGLLW